MKIGMSLLGLILMAACAGAQSNPAAVKVKALAIEGTRTRDAWTYYGGIMTFTGLDVAPDGETLWASTTRGLVRFDPKTERLARWTSLDGMADSEANGVCVDSQGRAWVATFSGLSCFDGKTFRSWGENEIGAHNLSTVTLDAKQRVWVGTTGRQPHGAACLIGERWARYSTEDNDAEFPYEINIMLPTPDGGLWVAGNYGRLPPGTAGYYARDRTVLVRISAQGAFWSVDLPKAMDPQKQPVHALALDRQNRLLLSCPAGIFRLEGTAWQPLPKDADLPAGGILQLKRASDGTLWTLAQKELGVIENDRYAKRFDIPLDLQPLFKPVGARLAIDTRQRIYIAPTSGYEQPDFKGGFVVCRNGAWTWYQPEIDGPSPLRGLSVWQIAEDKQGAMHFAGNRVGHVAYDGKSWRQLGEVGHDYCLGWDARRNYAGWIGGGQAVLEDGRSYPFSQIDPGNSGHLNECASLYLDSRGHVWIYGGGLFEIDGSKVTDHSKDEPLMAIPGPYPGGYGGLLIRALGEDDKGTLWVCANWGLFRWDGGAKWTFVGGKLDGMHGYFGWHSRINGKDRAIFCGSWGTSEYHIPSGRWFNYVQIGRHVPGAEAVMPGSYVENCGFDAEGHTWYGTYEGGVTTFDGDRWRYFTTQDGLACNSVWGLGCSRDGALWFGTPGGVSRFRPAAAEKSAPADR